MKEKKITKQELFLLKEHSTIENHVFAKLYDTHAVASEQQWKHALYWALLVAGIGFFVSGVVFFFAFNWDDIPAHMKFLLLGVGIVVGAYLAITPRVKREVNQMSLLATSMGIGVLLAVFGQTYQTGANAYDLFLTWFVVVTPLTLVSAFTYQWLFFSVLANTTLILALVQRLQVDSVFLGIILLLILNVLLYLLPHWKLLHRTFRIGGVYTHIQGVALFVLATAGFGFWLFAKEANHSPSEMLGSLVVLLLSVSLIGGGLGFGYWQRKIYLFSYALIAAVSCGLMIWMKLFEDTAEGFLVYMLYVIGGIFCIIKGVSMKSKAWKDEK